MVFLVAYRPYYQMEIPLKGFSGKISLSFVFSIMFQFLWINSLSGFKGLYVVTGLSGFFSPWYIRAHLVRIYELFAGV